MRVTHSTPNSLEDSRLEDSGLEDSGLEDSGLEDSGLEDSGLVDCLLPPAFSSSAVQDKQKSKTMPGGPDP